MAKFWDALRVTAAVGTVMCFSWLTNLINGPGGLPGGWAGICDYWWYMR